MKNTVDDRAAHQLLELRGVADQHVACDRLGVHRAEARPACGDDDDDEGAPHF
jgi:hypothetical protein